MVAMTERQTDGSLLSHHGTFGRKFGPKRFFTFASINVSISKYIVLWFSTVIVVTIVTFT